MYSCQGRRTLSLERSFRSARNPCATRSREIHIAEQTKENALKTNASAYPTEATAVPPRTEPTVTAVHCVICVKELAVCSSSSLAIAGKIDARPLVKNGE